MTPKDRSEANVRQTYVHFKSIDRMNKTLDQEILPYPIRFGILLEFDIPSILCSIFLLYLLLSHRKLRQTLHNHIIIILLIVNLNSQLLDNSFYLHYLRIGYVRPSSPVLCIIWILVGYQIYVTSTLLVALVSIQRHILIFHHRWILEKRNRLWIHYFPMLILLLYSLSYGCVLLILILTSQFTYDYNRPMCTQMEKWIKRYPGLSMWNLIVNELLPTPIIVVFSFALLVRVVRHKHLVGLAITWRKQRKMTMQLLAISILFCMINLPPILLHTSRWIRDEQQLPGIRQAQIYFSYFTYYQSIFLPFVCILSFVNDAKKLTVKMLKKTWPTFGEMRSFRLWI